MVLLAAMTSFSSSHLFPADAKLHFEIAKFHTEKVYQDEKCRILDLRTLLTESSNDILSEKWLEAVELLGISNSQRCDALRGLHSRQLALEDLTQSMSLKMHEIKSLKVYSYYSRVYSFLTLIQDEIIYLKRQSEGRDKASSEKSLLSEELLRLRTEADQGRSQNQLLQSLMSNKLLLERQLISLEVELDSVKRTFNNLRLQNV